MKKEQELTIEDYFNGVEYSAQFGIENYFPFPVGDETMEIEDYLYLYFTNHLRLNHTLFCINSHKIFDLGFRYSTIEEAAYYNEVISLDTDELIVYATATYNCRTSYCRYYYAIYRNWKTEAFYYIEVMYSRCLEVSPHQANNFAFLVKDTESEIKNHFKAVGAREYETLNRNYKIDILLDL